MSFKRFGICLVVVFGGIMWVWGVSMDLANTNLKELSVLKNYTCPHNLAHQNITVFQNEKKNVGEGLNINMCFV